MRTPSPPSLAGYAFGRGAPEMFLFNAPVAPWQPADSIAIGKLMAPASPPVPFRLFGPFGTGKTRTLTEYLRIITARKPPGAHVEQAAAGAKPAPRVPFRRAGPCPAPERCS